MLSQTHYDNYDGVPSPLTSVLSTGDINSTNFITTYNAAPHYAQKNNVRSNQVKGMVTWSRTKVLGTASQYLTQVNFYDEKGRLIQVQSVNQTGGKDVLTTQYDFSGKVLRTHLRHKKDVTSSQIYEVATRYNYDLLGRPTIIEKNINNTGLKKISETTYDALGQVRTKKLAPDYGSAGLETLTYDYNIRGWLLGANREYAKTAGSTSASFGFDLGYDKGAIAAASGSTIGSYATPALNGNISGMVWKSKGDGEIRKYDFSYDGVNRLMKADFGQHTGGAFNKTAGVDFSMNMGDGDNAPSAYDANGNIKSMSQTGLKHTASSPIDELTYTYQANSNRLRSVVDAVNDNTSTLGDFEYDAGAKGSDDYTYDANGNMTSDANKKISSITYNHLNLPQVITVTGKGTISYTYDATGNKLKKVTIENASAANNHITTTITTTYINGLVYESKADNDPQTKDYTDVLQFVPHEEGRIRPVRDESGEIISFVWDYFLKDHLGNVRMVLTEEQQTIYYPAATLEGTYSPVGSAQANSMVNYEKQFYKIDNTKIVSETLIPSWGGETVPNTKLYYNHNGNPPSNLNYPPSCTPTQTAGSSNLYKLNATSNKTGLEFMIKVMAGDKIDIFGKSYYLNTAQVTNGNSTAVDLLELMTNLLLAPENGAAGKGISAGYLQTLNTGLIPASFFRGNNSEASITIPKAYINYIFLDEQFKYAGGSASRVGASGTVKNHWNSDTQLQNITVPKNGYIFVYVSNESNINVFFDNLQVIHKPGPVLEETHYYPFGLRMDGISSRAAGTLQNKILYNDKELQSKEFSDGSGLELYDYGARMQDPQIGRWHVLDKLSDKYSNTSPYVYVLNRPTVAIDPDGERVYFVGGANNDRDGWNYINRFGTIWQRAGISDFRRVNASHGKIGDMLFTDNFRNKDNVNLVSRGGAFQLRVQDDKMLKKAVDGMIADLSKNPLKEGEQLNLTGYSYGGVMQAHVAVELIKKGYKVDNLILIASPTEDDSPIMKNLQEYQKAGKLGQIIRHDIPGDHLSNPDGLIEYTKGAWQNRKDSGPHFDLARPGAEADKKVKELAEILKSKGVK